MTEKLHYPFSEIQTIVLYSVFGIAIFMMLTAIIHSKNPILKCFYLSIISSFICVFYLLLDAPDVAMTEAAIGACISTVILLIFYKKIGFEPHLSRGKLYEKLYGFIISTIVILAFYKLQQIMPEIGGINSPINLGPAKYYIENTNQDIGITAYVAAILASYRGFDTLGETLVILIGAIAVSLILGIKTDAESIRNK